MKDEFLVKDHKVPSKIIWNAYLSIVFSSFSYCWPAFCDVPQFSYRRLVSIEKRACKWAGKSFSEVALRSRLDSISIRLIRKIAENHHNHPLAEFFDVRHQTRSLRRTRTLQIPQKTKALFRKSFIKYHTYS